MQLQWIEDSSEPPRALGELLANCAYFMWERRVGDPISFAQKALKVCDMILGPSDPDPIRAATATITGTWKLPVFSARRECLVLFQKAFDLRSRWLETVLKPSKNDFLQLENVYNNTGAAHLVLEEYDSALSLFHGSLSATDTLGYTALINVLFKAASRSMLARTGWRTCPYT